MLQCLRNRGPDGEGRWQHLEGAWKVSLMHRRLSIIDVAGGHQPMGNPQAQIVFNGEIFNFQELRSDLTQRGYNFQTQSDTEVLLHHMVERGTKGLQELDGMFAFGLWDHAKNQLVLARDRIGIKPLYYAPVSVAGKIQQGIVFASDLKTLLRSGMIQVKIEADAVSNYLFSEYAAAPWTFIKGVYKLPPGHFLTWQEGRLSEPVAYWQASQLAERPQIQKTLPEAAAQFDQLFLNSVAHQLIADVPVGVLLSGGLDSTAVTSAASRLNKKDLMTFSVEFDDPEFNEGPLARKISEQFKTRHYTLTVTEKLLLENLDEALASLDEPVADPSILPTYLLCKMTANHVKVALGGDGGNELFGGYPTYFAHRVGQAYRPFASVLHWAVKPSVMALPSSDGRWSLDWKLKRFFGRWEKDPVRRHLRWMAGTDSDLTNRLHEGKTDWSFQTARKFDHMMLVDLVTYLPSEVLAKVDRASMSVGLEVRPPFLSNELIDFAFSLPNDLKLRGSTTKILLREYVRTHVGDWISKVPKKGFGIPLNRWMKTVLRQRVQKSLIDDQAFHQQFGLNSLTIKKMWTEHLEGRQDHARTFWALLVLQNWFENLHSEPTVRERRPEPMPPNS